MIDYPRLRTPIMQFIAAAILAVIALKGDRLPEWIRILASVLALILGSAGVFSLADWIAHAIAERTQEIGAARIYAARALAQSLAGLTADQVDLVRRHDQVSAIGMIGGDDGPIWRLRCLTMDVPMDFVCSFVDASEETAPYLWPVRECDTIYPASEAYGRALTDTIVGRGWATPAMGSRPAKLMIPLEILDKRLGVMRT